MLLLLGALDFGRLMQARITAESAVRAGASWGATNIDNATKQLAPDYLVNACSNVAGGPACNIEARACAEAAGFPGFNGGPVLTGGDPKLTYQACQSGSAAGVCQAGPNQSNPFLTVTYTHADGSTFTPPPADVGDTIEVQGTFCFQTFIPWPQILNQMTWTTSSSYVIQP